MPDYDHLAVERGKSAFPGLASDGFGMPAGEAWSRVQQGSIHRIFIDEEHFAPSPGSDEARHEQL